jgi:hypothetical protein
MPNDERLQPKERIVDDEIRGEITDEMIRDDEVRRFGQFVEVKKGMFRDWMVSLRIRQQSFRLYSTDDEPSALKFRDLVCRAIHQLVNDVINLQADKIENLYLDGMPHGQLIGTQQQILVLSAFLKQSRSILDNLNALSGKDCCFAGDGLCEDVYPVDDWAPPRANWCATCSAERLILLGENASNSARATGAEP